MDRAGWRAGLIGENRSRRPDTATTCLAVRSADSASGAHSRNVYDEREPRYRHRSGCGTALRTWWRGNRRVSQRVVADRPARRMGMRCNRADAMIRNDRRDHAAARMHPAIVIVIGRTTGTVRHSCVGFNGVVVERRRPSRRRTIMAAGLRRLVPRQGHDRQQTQRDDAHKHKTSKRNIKLHSRPTECLIRVKHSDVKLSLRKSTIDKILY